MSQFSSKSTLMFDYYKNKFVKKRINEYLKSDKPEYISAVYVSECDRALYNSMEVKPPEEIRYYLSRGSDVARSLWDNNCLIAHLDIEYVNFDFPAEPYLDVKRSFDLQKPVILVIEKIMSQYSISPLHLITGRGHHFVWSIENNSKAFRILAEFNNLNSSLKAAYKKKHPPAGRLVTEDLGNAFSGLGMVMEWLAYQIKEESSHYCKLPVEITDVCVGPVERGREIISIDISEYGDPLYTRVIRIPFSVYRKPYKKSIIHNKDILKKIPKLFMIPLYEINIDEAIEVMQNEKKVKELAERATVQIPKQSETMCSMINAYKNSSLKTFHDWFYSQEHNSPEDWHKTYDITPLEKLPPCVRHIFMFPNNLLLKPAGIGLVVKTMLSLGWHPRHIAGLIRSKYERNYGWGNEWFIYDAATRADFYTRIFSGLFVTGKDDLVDFNCISNKEKKFCFNPDRHCDLDNFRESLLRRREYDGLANRPFNGLFL